MTFTHHSQTINYLIQRFKFQSYAEIGLHNPRGNFDLINCKLKISVDPSTVYGKPSFVGTSDEFFAQNKQTFDCIFLDGLHTADQVKKDFENSLACLNEGGIILIHDTSPEHEKFTVVPRGGLKGRWNGSVYKFMFEIWGYEGIDFRTLDFDSNGLTVVKRSNTIADPIDFIVHAGHNERGYADFDYYRKGILQLCTQKEFEDWV